jgi:hypothetical protein
MYWKHPPVVKLYEALGAVADGRVKVEGDGAKVYSSSGNKFYEVKYDPNSHAIMVNDNASFYKGYLGYPAVAYLMQIGVLPYPKEAAEALKGIPWKDLNTKFKNDFVKALEFVLSQKPLKVREMLDGEVARIDSELKKMKFKLLGEKMPPPKGY